MEKAKELRQQFLDAGGTISGFETVANGGMSFGDDMAQDGSQDGQGAMDHAIQCLKVGSLIEYECYDHRGRNQGTGIVRFIKWRNQGDLNFEGVHLLASDAYYDWWAKKNLPGRSTAYHLCVDRRRKCGVQGEHGVDPVHITRWHIVSPKTLLGSDYARALGLQELGDRLNDELARAQQGSFPPPPPAGPSGAGGAAPAASGTGLDAAVGHRHDADGEADEGVDQLLELSRQAKAGKPEKGAGSVAKTKEQKKASGGLAQILAARAVTKAEETDRSRSRRKAKQRRTDDSRKRGRSKTIKVGSESDGDSSHSTESEPDFRKASSREVDLVELSKRNPGCLLRSALKEMTRYLAARGEADIEDPGQGRVLGYLHQILLPQYPKAGIRAQRELVTIGSALDLLLSGDLGRAGDLLAQRFKALEASLAAEGSWAVARHHELIPGQATLSTQREMTEAAKAEMRAQKLKNALHRGQPGGNK